MNKMSSVGFSPSLSTEKTEIFNVEEAQKQQFMDIKIYVINFL